MLRNGKLPNHLPYYVNNDRKLYQPIYQSNLFAFDMHYLGGVVFKERRKNNIANLTARHHL